MLGYLPADIICSERRIAFHERKTFSEAKYAKICSRTCPWARTNVQGQKSDHIFAPNGSYCGCYPSNLFRNTRSFENWGIIRSCDVFNDLHQSHANDNI